MYIIPDHFNGKKTVTEASVAALQPNLRNRPIITVKPGEAFPSLTN